jgi:hypothetical protein
MPRLENWQQVGDRLEGNVRGDWRFQEGQFVTTSPIVAGPVLLGNALVARTKTGTIYELPVRCCNDVPYDVCRDIEGCDGCPAEKLPVSLSVLPVSPSVLQ